MRTCVSVSVCLCMCTCVHACVYMCVCMRVARVGVRVDSATLNQMYVVYTHILP